MEDPPPELHRDQQVSVDEFMQNYLSDFGSSQFFQSLLVSIPSIFDAQQTFITVFTDAYPSWHCTGNDTVSCTSSSDICTLPASSWAWDREPPPHVTIVSQFGLQCSSSFLSNLPASSYFAGCLAGGLILSILGDSWVGRKMLLLSACLLMSLSAFFTTFSPNVFVYSALKFLTGVGRVGIATSALVLAMERVGKQRRGKVGMARFFSFTIGLLSLPAMAYASRNKSWKSLYLWTSVPAIFYCIVGFFLVHESPRWLYTQGRPEEAKAILKKLSKHPHGPNTVNATMPEVSVGNTRFSYTDLFKKRWMVRRIFATMTLGLGVGMVYFGMLLGVGNLGFNVYLTLFFNGLLLIPSQLLIFFFIERWSRKSSLLVFCLTSGLCSIVCAVLGSRNKVMAMTVFELASFFCASSAYNVLMIYTTELFPTCVRNSATTTVRIAVLVAPVVVPMLSSAGREYGYWLSYGVFGVTIGVCGLFVLLLPETRGTVLCDTMEQQEHKDNSDKDNSDTVK